MAWPGNDGRACSRADADYSPEDFFVLEDFFFDFLLDVFLLVDFLLDDFFAAD